MIGARKRRSLTSLGLGFAWVCLSAVGAEAAPLRSYSSTANDHRAIVLDQDGRRIPIPRAGGAFPEGTTPTYLAHRLPGRGAVPDGTPTVNALPGRGAAGPLRLTPLAIRSLNADLAQSNQVAVIAPGRAFLVERAAGPALLDATATTQFWRAAIRGGQEGKSIGDALEGWYDSGTDAVKKFNDSILDGLKKTFTPPAPKPVILGSTVAAQEFDAGSMRSRTDEPPVEATQPAPVPEPSTWLVFAAAAVAGLRIRARSRKSA